MDYIHVRNLEKYHQGYEDRKLIWAKIYFNMVQGDPDCEMITNEIDWSRLIKFILLELQAQKPIPIDEAYLTRKGFNLKERKISLTLQVLHSFLETVTEPLQNRNLDKEVEVEVEVEVDKSKNKKENKEESQSLVVPSAQLQPHQQLVENFKTLYQALSGHPYNDQKTDYIIMAGLVKKHGAEAVIKKIEILGALCKSGAQWFTKAGWADLTIGKLSKFWNEILPVETDADKAKRIDAEIKAKTEAQSEFAKQCVEAVRSGKHNI